ncbi:MAG: alpha/beta hydrolase [Chloroflexia bacterium]|nr:alpha/beta hydrolase [Chloroflexia bacterium]
MHPELEFDTTYSIQAQTKKYNKEYPYIVPISYGDTSKLTIHHNLVYENYRTRKLHLDVAYLSKKSKKRLPAVILVHGGGWRSGDKSMQEPMAYELARNGFITFIVEYRLSTEAIYPAGLVDIKTTIRWIKKNALSLPVDTTCIALLGCSSGGQMVSLLGSIKWVL